MAGYTNQQQADVAAFGRSPTGFPWIDQRDPNENDIHYKIGQFWINTTDEEVWYLNSQNNQITMTNPYGLLKSEWVLLSSSIFNMESISGDDAVIVNPIANNIQTLGNTVANATHPKPLFTQTPGSNIEQWDIQVAAAIPTPDINLTGLAAFNDAQFTVDPTGFVSLLGGGEAIDAIAIDGSTPPGTNPVPPNLAGIITIVGSQVATGTTANVIRTFSVAANAFQIQVQRTTTAASTTLALNGVSHFNSAQFTVDANGFVSTSGTGIANTITGDSGGALSPTAGNWNILGRSGSKTSGSVSTLTINSPPYTDQAGSTTVTLNSGSFATNAITLTTPVSAGLLDGDLLEFVATNGVLVIQLAATQVAHLGSAVTSAAGTITGSATGDSISLRYQASTNDWWATSAIGIFILA